MKKLLILIMVLGIGSLTNATVIISSSSNTVDIGGTVTISVISSDYSWYTKYLDLEGPAEFGNILILPAAGPFASADRLENTIALSTMSPLPGLHFLIETIATGNINDTFTVALINGLDFTVEDSETITIIPEPATMALLCIGGMLIKRRK